MTTSGGLTVGGSVSTEENKVDPKPVVASASQVLSGKPSVLADTSSAPLLSVDPQPLQSTPAPNVEVKKDSTVVVSSLMASLALRAPIVQTQPLQPRTTTEDAKKESVEVVSSVMNSLVQRVETRETVVNPIMASLMQRVDREATERAQRRDEEAKRDALATSVMADEDIQALFKETELEKLFGSDASAHKKLARRVVDHVLRESEEFVSWMRRSSDGDTASNPVVINYKDHYFQSMYHLGLKLESSNDYKPNLLMHVTDASKRLKKGSAVRLKGLGRDTKEAEVELKNADIYIPVCVGGDKVITGAELKSTIQAYLDRGVAHVYLYRPEFDDLKYADEKLAEAGDAAWQSWLSTQTQAGNIPNDSKVVMLSRAQLAARPSYQHARDEVVRPALRIDAEFRKKILDDSKKWLARKLGKLNAALRQLPVSSTPSPNVSPPSSPQPPVSRSLLAEGSSAVIKSEEKHAVVEAHRSAPLSLTPVNPVLALALQAFLQSPHYNLQDYATLATMLSGTSSASSDSVSARVLPRLSVVGGGGGSLSSESLSTNSLAPPSVRASVL